MSKSDAKNKVLITYTFKDVSLNNLLEMVKKYKTKCQLVDNIILIYGKVIEGEDDNDKKEFYKKEII